MSEDLTPRVDGQAVDEKLTQILTAVLNLDARLGSWSRRLSTDCREAAKFYRDQAGNRLSQALLAELESSLGVLLNQQQRPASSWFSSEVTMRTHRIIFACMLLLSLVMTTMAQEGEQETGART